MNEINSNYDNWPTQFDFVGGQLGAHFAGIGIFSFRFEKKNQSINLRNKWSWQYPMPKLRLLYFAVSKHVLNAIPLRHTYHKCARRAFIGKFKFADKYSTFVDSRFIYFSVLNWKRWMMSRFTYRSFVYSFWIVYSDEKVLASTTLKFQLKRHESMEKERWKLYIKLVEFRFETEITSVHSHTHTCTRTRTRTQTGIVTHWSDSEVPTNERETIIRHSRHEWEVETAIENENFTSWHVQIYIFRTDDHQTYTHTHTSARGSVLTVHTHIHRIELKLRKRRNEC